MRTVCLAGGPASQAWAESHVTNAVATSLRDSLRPGRSCPLIAFCMLTAP